MILTCPVPRASYTKVAIKAEMFSEHIKNLFGISSLQGYLRDVSVGNILALLGGLLVVGITVDYARMLWLRSKMVCLMPSL